MVEQELTISKVEEDVFRYTGLDVKMVSDGIEILMEDYSRSLKEITNIRTTDDRSESLTKLEMKIYKKMTGKIAWLAFPNPCTQYILLVTKKSLAGYFVPIKRLIVPIKGAVLVAKKSLVILYNIHD